MKILSSPGSTLAFALGLVALIIVALPGVATELDSAAEQPVSESEESASESHGSESEQKAGEQTAEEYSNKIRWTTASEVDNFGFDVYRSESEDGPFELLTEQPLEGGGTIDEPRKYVFVDDTIDPTKVYYYYVESVSMDGVRERFTPVVRAKPKKPQSED